MRCHCSQNGSHSGESVGFLVNKKDFPGDIEMNDFKVAGKSIENGSDFASQQPNHQDAELRHRNVGAGGARAAVFGISDGLVTNVSLVLGVTAAHTAVGVVRLAGLAGLMGGAFSMAAGEYVSMKAQRELLERELEIERREIELYPDWELNELVSMYVDRGIDQELAKQLALNVMADPVLALEAHAREELGIDPGSLGSPWQAAFASFITFAIGAVIPLLSFFFVGKTTAVLISVIASAVTAFAVGGVLSFFTGRSMWWSAGRQVLICAVAGAATFAIGAIVGGGAA